MNEGRVGAWLEYLEAENVNSNSSTHECHTWTSLRCSSCAEKHAQDALLRCLQRAEVFSGSLIPVPQTSTVAVLG